MSLSYSDDNPCMIPYYEPERLCAKRLPRNVVGQVEASGNREDENDNTEKKRI